MPKKRHSAEQIIHKLREAEVTLSQGQIVGAVCKQIGVTQQAYCWRKEDGGLQVDQAKRLEDLAKENARLKEPIADQALDNAIPRGVVQGDL